MALLALARPVLAADPATNAVASNAPAAVNLTVATNAPVAGAVSGASNLTSPTVSNTTTAALAAPASNAVSTNASDVTVISDTPVTPTNEVRMNFHDAPLGTVLKYLSARMGFVIATDVKEFSGTATIISEQPVNKDEVISLLSAALAKNGYTVSRNGRLLAITTTESATTGAQTPVLQAASPTNIPMSEEMATVILPVQTLNPTQLIKDLDQLIPPGAKVAANESGNAVIMTAREKDIHRFSEIISALDSSSVSEVRVFVLTNADAKSVASELKEVFQSPDSSVARSDRSQRFRGFFGGGFPGGGGDNANSDQKNAANKAVFVSDDQINAVVAAAPPSYFEMITNVITQLDQPSDEVSEVHTFHLTYADAQETADELSNLFPDETKSNDQNNRSYGMRFMPPWMQTPSPSSSPSERMKRQATVRAVPDLRTHSVIVTASRGQMLLIAKLIAEVDSDPAMVQHVYSIDIVGADPTAVQSLMTTLFAGQNTKAPTSTQASALQQRSQTDAQQQQSTTTGFGAGGAGGTSSLR
jgi:type II secretory pathway component GspD/PulD (secretin)